MANALTENPEGVALNRGWVNSSAPNVSFVHFSCEPCTKFVEFILERHRLGVLILVRYVSFGFLGTVNNLNDQIGNDWELIPPLF
jgi:hypothetical protein